MSSNTTRVHYFDRQYLRKDELSDEQAYELSEVEAAFKAHTAVSLEKPGCLLP